MKMIVAIALGIGLMASLVANFVLLGSARAARRQLALVQQENDDLNALLAGN